MTTQSPSVETLEKIARLGMQLFQLLYDGPESPHYAKPSVGKGSLEDWGKLGRGRTS